MNIKFKVNHFSKYAIVSYQENDIGISQPGQIEQPKTGDNSLMNLYGGLTILSLIGIGIFVKRKRKED